MIHLIPDLLSAEQVTLLRELAANKEFVDGRATNAQSRVKHNQQIDQQDKEVEAAGDVVVRALFGHPLVQRTAFPRTIPAPTIARYVPGMHYGPHLDEAVLQTRPQPMRSDMSCSVFLNEPEEYEGGELEIWLGSERPRIKGRAGSAVIYPTGVIHQVLPVTAGQRLVAVTWMQSRIPSAQHRHILFHHLELMHRLGPKCDEGDKLLLESVRTNLMRLWVDP
ncbi:Fe2+-dependent dioxygenase [Pseudomarimonas arenosa]|uniref:Fe2+-dependent dioxygenase n=1 Tax=Pseudomarimonas arenosa TaxID=2774145 RepID=A0AAW3ZJF8_9GAMM|nr:Fe2+-dependent dioxygenase [Pseudomarimonas arenosa]MBD8524827.1 Fe2+-dependent dioxygenase [Pseudomarimonas arenosa]